MNELEQQLIKRIQSGDKPAFDLLFRTYYGIVFFIAKDILGNKELAEEMTQDVFVKLWESKAKLTITLSLRSYLTSMVRNRCIDYLRSLKSKQHIKTISIENAEVRMKLYDMQSTLTTGEEFFPDMTEIVLKKALDNLAPQCKQIFELSRFEGYTHQQIAEMLHISIGSVKKQLFRALQKLKEAMGQ